MKQALPAASASYSGSDGFDALQIERLAVTQERVLLCDFCALEAIALADLRAGKVWAAGRDLAGFRPLVCEQTLGRRSCVQTYSRE